MEVLLLFLVVVSLNGRVVRSETSNTFSQDVSLRPVCAALLTSGWALTFSQQESCQKQLIWKLDFSVFEKMKITLFLTRSFGAYSQIQRKKTQDTTMESGSAL